MKTAGFARQHEPELGAPLELSPARGANDGTHGTSHERSQRCIVAVEVDAAGHGPGLRRHGEGERALMRAVLTDAIRCLAGRGREGQLLKVEARRWVASRDLRWPFSFEGICCALDLDPQTIRRQLGVQARAGMEEGATPLPGRCHAGGAAAAPAGTCAALAADDRPLPGLDAVTPRERQIIRLVAFGLRNAEVAATLHITRRTVTTHLANVFRKLGIHERRELLAFAHRTAIV
jgi:DNA-binding CsgD family transcriptional regulator